MNFSLFFLFLNPSVVGVDDVFFSMADMDMSHSLSSLPPLGEPPTVDLDLSLNSNYSASPGESPSGNATVSLLMVTLLDAEILNKVQCHLICIHVLKKLECI